MSCREVNDRLRGDSQEDVHVDTFHESDEPGRQVTEKSALTGPSVQKCLILTTPANKPHMTPAASLVSRLQEGSEPNFGDMGRVSFRGTCADLANSYLDVAMFTDELPSDIGVTRKPS
eukprot:4306262-Amphidinium_carterae.1